MYIHVRILCFLETINHAKLGYMSLLRWHIFQHTWCAEISVIYSLYMLHKYTKLRYMAKLIFARLFAESCFMAAQMMSLVQRLTLTLYVQIFSDGTKHISTFYVIPPHWHDKGSYYPCWSKTRTYLFYIVNIMDADVLARQGARASATIPWYLLCWTRLSRSPHVNRFNLL